MAEQKSTRGKPKQGKVWVKTDKGLYPFRVLKKSEKEGRSKQPKNISKYITENNLVPVPFAVEGVLDVIDNVSVVDSCARQIAQDVTAKGWQIVPVSKEAEPDKDEEKRAKILLEEPNSQGDTFSQVIEKMIIDYMTIGWEAMEVSRSDNNNQPNGLFHLPASELRRHKSEDLFCQVQENSKTWYKKFGVKKDIDSESGKWKEVKDPGNEVIFAKRYYQRSHFYGVPPVLPAVGAARGLYGVREYNLAFFENYGIPAGLVTLEGDWEEDSIKYLNDFLDVEIKKAENSHKTLVAEVPTGGKFKFEPLVTETKEGSFSTYKKELRDEILMVYRMPPYRIGIAEVGKLGGSTARESNEYYNDSVIWPLKIMMQNLINTTILGPKGLGFKRMKFIFNELLDKNLDKLTDRWKKWFSMGIVNRNWLCSQLGLPFIPVEQGGNDYYIQAIYMPIGEESVQMRERALHATQEELSGKVEEIIQEFREKEKQDKKEK